MDENEHKDRAGVNPLAAVGVGMDIVDVSGEIVTDALGEAERVGEAALESADVAGQGALEAVQVASEVASGALDVAGDVIGSLPDLLDIF